MTQNPYAGGAPYEDRPQQSRTSVLAIGSLIMGILCLLPIVAQLAVLTGGAAIIRISTSGGRRRGLGLAVAGIVLGLIGSVFHIAMLVGSQQITQIFTTGFTKPLIEFVENGLDGQYAESRVRLTPPASEATDARMAEFFAIVRADFGGVAEQPTGMLQFFSLYGQVQQSLASAQTEMDRRNRAGDNPIPIPVLFDNGPALFVVLLDADATQGATPATIVASFTNIAVVRPDGTVEWLVDPDGP